MATVVASGNDGYVNAIAAPACISTAMSVGSIASETLDVSFFSDSSASLDFVAPGAANNEDPNGPLFEGVWSSVPDEPVQPGRPEPPWPRPTWPARGR